VSLLTATRQSLGTPVVLAGGALLLCGIFAGQVAAGLGLPRLTGYLVIGVVVGPHGLGFIPREGVQGLELVKGLAVSLIALTAGTELRWPMLRRLGIPVLRTGTATAGAVFLLVTAALVALAPVVPFLRPLPFTAAVAVSAVLASVVASFSPTVTIAIIQETRARGSFTELLMAVVILGDLVVMLLFALTTGWARAALGHGMDPLELFGGVSVELFGSLAVGVGLGVAMLVYLQRVGREVPVFLAAVCLASAEMGVRLHLSPLLVSLAAGAVVANLHGREGERLNQAVEKAGLPVFALFFAAAGAGLHLEAVLSLGPVALALALLRAGAIWMTTRRLAPAEDPRSRQLLWMGLVSQAGVTVGLASLLARTFEGFGAQMEALILTMVTLHELVGPLLTRRALVRSGEVSPR
jgi:Kef-type K+ transport system membrane component KefB